MKKSPLIIKHDQSSVNKKDGWGNVLSGLGSKKDKNSYNYFNDILILDKKQLSAIYIGDGIGKRIVKTLPDDMTKRWIEINDDPKNKAKDELDRLHTSSIFNQALRWQRLYGGSLIVIGSNDGAALDEPLPAKVKSINYLKVYPSTQVVLDSANIDKDPLSETFGEIIKYKIKTNFGTEFEVHYTRCLVFKSEELPNDLSLSFSHRYWGLSSLQEVYDRLSNFGSSEVAITSTLQEFIISVFKLSNLAEMLNDKEGKSKVYDRMEIINASKSVINSVLLGEDEEFSRNTASLSGIPEILDRMMITISASTGYPVTKLWGRSPAGQNATGESDTNNYYDWVSTSQENQLKEPITKLLSIINTYLDTSISFSFKAVSQPSEKEEIEMKNKQSITDKTYIETGVLTPEEVRQNRFENGYNYDTSVDSYTSI